MARLRYSLEKARAEATRLAEAFIADRPDRDKLKHHRTFPDLRGSSSQASKHPVAWVAVFVSIPPDGSVIDGGELCVAVDLQSASVGIQKY